LRIEDLADVRRSPERWEPFMAGLKEGLRIRRRRKTARALFSVAAILLFGALFLLFPGKRESGRLLAAGVPSLSDATFVSRSGTTFIARNVVTVRTEAGP